jgi:uncharacterized Tic20 family protein
MDSSNNPPPIHHPSAVSRENWRLYFELLSFAFFIFPFGNIFGPLVLWLIKKDSIPAVDEEGRKVLNFNLSWLIWSFITCGVGAIPWFIIAVVATFKAANQTPFKHPWVIRFLA